MIEWSHLTPEFAIGPQPIFEDFARIRDGGFSSIINVRPDGEAGEYLDAQSALTIAKDLDLEYAHCPVENHAIFESHLTDCVELAISRLPKPIFAHCKSGTRAAILWALVAVRHRPVLSVIETLKSAGQDLEFLEQELHDSALEKRRSPLRLKDDALLALSQSNIFGPTAT